MASLPAPTLNEQEPVMSKPEVTAFFDVATFTVSYVVADSENKVCAIVDSVLDYDPVSGRTNKTSADELIAFIKERGFELEWILETHVHADHLSAAPYIQDQLGGKLAIGARITDIQEVFGKIFNAETEFQRDGSQFDKLFVDGDTFKIGAIEAQALHTPGHTPACMTYVIGDAAFVGDTMFMPDYGTARTDFPGGDARTLFKSIKRIFELPSDTRLFMCHDYKAPGRDEYSWESTIAQARAHNVHVHDGITEDEFVAMREKRDATLDMPRLILPSVQINMRAGDLPPPEENGQRYLKIPLDTL